MTTTTKAPAILIVDDEASLREMLEIMLKREGYEVSTANDGAAALKTMTKREFDAVITDVAMPGMSGIELLTKARQQNHDAAVIVITAQIGRAHV